MDIIIDKGGLAPPPAKKAKTEAEKGRDPFQTIASRLQSMRSYILQVRLCHLDDNFCLASYSQ
jgi:hypothetical protein